MALISTTSEQETYKGVSLLLKNYFLLLCKQRGYTSGFRVESEDNPRSITYTITVTDRETYDLMQRVFDDANA